MKPKKYLFNILYFFDKLLFIFQTQYPTLWGIIFRKKTYLGLISSSFILLAGQVAGLGFTDFFNALIEKSSSNSEKFFYKLLDIYFGGSWQFIIIFFILTLFFVIGKIFEDKGAFSKKIFNWSFFQDKYLENMNSSVKNKYISELHTDNQLSEILIRILGGQRFEKIFNDELEKQQVIMYKDEFEININNLFNLDVDSDFIEIQSEFRNISKGKDNIFENLLEKIIALKENFVIGNYKYCKILKDEVNQKLLDINNYYKDYNELYDKLIKDNDKLKYYSIDKEEFKKKNNLTESQYNIEIEKRKRNSDILSRPFFSMSEYAITSIENLFRMFNYLESQELHISGGAGVGKTHTLFSLYEKIIKTKNPAIFILGQNLITDKFFETQIRELLDIQNNITIDDFLNLLNKQGELYRCKIPIIIDGLNESLHWKHIFKNLSSFITKIKKYSNIVLITSYRTNYEYEIFGDYKLEIGGHYLYGNKYIIAGFTGDFDDLFEKYIKHYNISIQNTFNKYLFEDKIIYLKMFCEVNKGKKSVTINSLSFSKIFEDYIKKCNEHICNKLDKDLTLNKNFSINILEKIGQLLWNNDLRLVSKNQLLKDILEEKELTIFLREDLLLYKNLNLNDEDSIGFTYDLFGGYIIAKLILEENKTDIEKFIKSDDFKEKILEKKHPLFDDILECLTFIFLKEKIFIFEYLENDLVNEKLIEIIHDLEKEFLIENKDKILPFLEKAFKGNYKNKIFDNYVNKPFDLDYPINVNFWHSILLDLSLADRDEIWTIKISNDYEINNWIDELRNQITEVKNKYKDGNEKLLLIGEFFSWFLSSTNNKNRDNITKLLVELFTDKPISYLKLLEKFLDVNDPYVIQRILAIGLGVTIRSDISEEIKNLVKFIYDYFYIKNNIPIDILSRDYIKIIVEYGNKILLLSEIDIDKIKYPYNSEFDIENIPTFEELRNFSDSVYVGKEGYHDYIWSSVMYSQGSLADFGRYTLESKLSSWLNIKINEPKIPTLEELEEEFNNSLSKELLNEYNEFQKVEEKEHLSKVYELINNSSSKKEYLSDKLESEFIKHLNTDQLNCYTKLKDFRNKSGVFGDINGFDTKIAERWLYDRVIKLGYDINKHGNFDYRIGRAYHNRGGNDIERIGKKYQWIALYELLARISDNYKFRDDGYSNKEVTFKSPQTTYIRDIDTTYISKLNELWGFDEELDKYLYTSISNKDFITNSDNLSLGEWVKSESGIPNYKELIERIDDNGIEWINLEGFYSITEKSDKDNIQYNGKKQFWNQVRSYLVNKEDFLCFKDWLGNKSFMGRELMPESSDNHYSYIGEWYWSEGYNELHIPYYGYQEWTNNYGKLPKEVLITVENYYSERKGDDVEGYGNTKILLLSKYIAERLGARWDDKKSAIVNKSGDIIGFNPILYGIKENSLLIRKDILIKFLNDNNLKIVFTVLGEKMVLGDSVKERNTINGVYYFNYNKNIDGGYNCLIEGN